MSNMEESATGQNLTLVLELKLMDSSGLDQRQNFITIARDLAHFLNESGLVHALKITGYLQKDGSNLTGDTHYLNGSLGPITE